MNVLLLSVQNSPFTQEQAELLNRVLPSLSAEQSVWLNGFLAGIRAISAPPANGAVALATAGAAPTSLPEVTVLFGSQSGNAMRLASELSRRLQQRGMKATVSCMSEFRPNNLKKASHLLVVTSTHGEGDPPDKAIAFHEFLHSRRAPKLEGVGFSVLALGDLSYKKFCQTGKNFDQRLEELGGKRLFPRVDCDVDYHEKADGWMQGVIDALAVGNGHASGNGHAASAFPAAAVDGSVPAYSRLQPFPAEVLENFTLNGRGSDKETRYLKLSLEGSGLTFEPGDALGIIPQNDPQLVDDLIGQMGWQADERVPVGKQEVSLRDALTQHYEITLLTRPLLEQAANFSRDGLRKLVCEGRDEDVQAYIEGRDLLDLARDFSLAGVPAREFLGTLRKLPPRLYSISSSHKANPDEVDLTISVVRYRAHDRNRQGTCSAYCSQRVTPGDRLPVYVNSNPNFRLPANPDAPIIMVGAGTGVAPYRAFLEEREELGAGGKNWLFFGDRRFRTDFLYQLDWLRWRKRGLLTRIDAAFSRDTQRKVYVQQRMLERGRELFAWLQEGAYFYVCGDQKRLAPDVHAALETIVEQEGHLSADDAKAYVTELQRQNRYQRDVY